MEKKTITITIKYDENEGSILVGDLILAKIYATKDGLMVGTIDETDKEQIEHKK